MNNKYLCMSYNKYLTRRKKLSKMCSMNENNRVELINFIRTHPDYELKRQYTAFDNTTNTDHKNLHLAKINDLIELATIVKDQRVAYMKLRDSNKETRLNDHIQKTLLEKENKLLNRKNKIFATKQLNIARIADEMSRRDAVRLQRESKRLTSNLTTK